MTPRRTINCLMVVVSYNLLLSPVLVRPFFSFLFRSFTNERFRMYFSSLKIFLEVKERSKRNNCLGFLGRLLPSLHFT